MIEQIQQGEHWVDDGKGRVQQQGYQHGLICVVLLVHMNIYIYIIEIIPRNVQEIL